MTHRRLSRRSEDLSEAGNLPSAQPEDAEFGETRRLIAGAQRERSSGETREFIPDRSLKDARFEETR
jgi:hypothetical protein